MPPISTSSGSRRPSGHSGRHERVQPTIDPSASPPLDERGDHRRARRRRGVRPTYASASASVAGTPVHPNVDRSPLPAAASAATWSMRSRSRITCGRRGRRRRVRDRCGRPRPSVCTNSVDRIVRVPCGDGRLRRAPRGNRWLRCTRRSNVPFGPIEDLRLIERESPALRPGTVRIAVSACGVNFVDGVIVAGPVPDQAAGAVRAGDGGGRPVTEVGEGVSCSAGRCAAIGCSPTPASVGSPARRSCRRAGVGGRPRITDRRPGRHVHAELHDGVLRRCEHRAPGAGRAVAARARRRRRRGARVRSTSARRSGCR